MKKRIFYADKDGTVEALDIKIDAAPEDIKVLINGIDITETLEVERVEIILEKKEEV